MFKNFFKRKKEDKSIDTSSKLFPGEDFSVGYIQTKEGDWTVNINHAFDNYPYKQEFQWCAQILIEFKDKNESGFPTDKEAVVLNQIEDKIVVFFQKKHKVHFIGRITRKDFRDLIFYINTPEFDKESTKLFFDEINSIRRINFEIDNDPAWNIVSGFLK